MNIIIFGATGKTGHELVTQSLEKGYKVTAVVRNPTKMTITHPHLTIEQGDLTNYTDVTTIVKAQPYDAVFSALGAKTPFQRDPILTKATKNIIQAAAENHIDKFIHVSFIGVRKESSTLGMLYKYIAPVVMKNLIADHREKEAVLASSGLNWIAVQPPILTSGAKTGNYIHEQHINKGISSKKKLSRANLADFMIQQLQQDTYHQSAVFVTE